jgi:hypothetical protein
MPARSIAALTATVPSWGAVRVERVPLMLPMGVRADERM